MSEEKNFVQGMIIKLDELGAWISTQKREDNELEWINIEIKEGRSGKWYAERNMWKPSDDSRHAAAAPSFEQKVEKASQDIPW